MDVMIIKDTQTKELHKVPPSGNTVWVTSRDGTRIRLHPVIIKMMVMKGTTFDAQTLIGVRAMIRI